MKLSKRTFLALLASMVAYYAAEAFVNPSSSSALLVKGKSLPSLSLSRRQHHVVLQSQPTKSTAEASDDTTTTTGTSKLGLLTFDLDDTLFPIGPVVQDANNAMVSAILSLGYRSVTNADVLAATKSIRQELSKTDTPITYTELRIQAIQNELERALERLGGNKDAIHESVARHIFDIWLKARHESAERNLYPDAISVLQDIKSTHPEVVIGAVTNGRGDPLDMRQTLRPHFDFTISGEDEGVFPHRKPHRGIFDATLAKHESMVGYDITSTKKQCWVHVGDDLANDVGASAAVGAKAIWYDMDDEEEDCSDGSSKEGNKAGATPVWSTASTAEVEKRKKMAEEAQKSVTRRITTLAELPSAIDDILREESKIRQI